MRPLSPSRLARFRKSPPLYFEDGNAKDTRAFRLGRAAHALVLEGPAVYEARYTKNGPVNPSTRKPYGIESKAVQKWEKKHGKVVISEDDDATIKALAHSVHEHKRASSLLTGGKAEIELCAEYCGIPCHGWLDYYIPGEKVVDFKTCDDIDAFEGQAKRHGYLHQVAFYRMLAALDSEKKPTEIEVFFIAAEKKSPFRCGVWRAAHDVLAVAQRENEAAIERLKWCIENNEWRTGYENTRTIDWIY